jgi:RNA polymerase sigma factor (sigma-70 family)
VGHDRSRERLPFLCEDCTDCSGDDSLCPDCREKVARRNELAMENSGLVGYTLKRYYRLNPLARQHYPKDDAFAEGFLGLLRAAELYDPTTGYTFGTYASYWILQALGRGWDKHWHMIHKPAYLDEIPVQASSYHDFEAIVRRVSDKDAASPEVRELQSIVRGEIAKMHPRYANVLLQRLHGRTYSEIAEDLDVSRERARQIALVAKLCITKRLRKVFACSPSSLPG